MLPGFPVSRPRRLRARKAIRDLVAGTRISVSSLMLPVFVDERLKAPTSIEALPGHQYYPPESNELVELVTEALNLGVKSFLLFGVPSVKDDKATRAYAEDGPVQKALRNLRRELGWEPVIATDLCICNYTSQGHCGLVSRCREGLCIDNDSTLEIYRKIAVSQAEAGADIIAPSGMMDGQVAAIRGALDDAGYRNVAIMAYSAKFASNFYGPFRDVMDSSPRFGDRSSYQLDPRNAWDAIREVYLDVMEGADILMVKPALPYLDVIRLVKERIDYLPLAAYNVSGEYMAVELLSRQGYADRAGLMMEILYSIKRAGADIIITYHALEAAKILQGDA